MHRSCASEHETPCLSVGLGETAMEVSKVEIAGTVNRKVSIALRQIVKSNSGTNPLATARTQRPRLADHRPGLKGPLRRLRPLTPARPPAPQPSSPLPQPTFAAAGVAR